MAIYTNYGRYLKAKLFKEMLDEQNDTYMLFGIGNPQWDDTTDTNGQDITIAPYNTDIATYGTSSDNQFFDDNTNIWFQEKDSGDSIKIEQAIKNGKPNCDYSINPPTYTNGEWIGTGSDTGLYMYKCRRLIPSFPCIWQNYSDGDNKKILDCTISDTPTEINQNNYHQYYITKELDNNYYVKNQSGAVSDIVAMPADSELKIQYFTEMYIRGRALKNNIKVPVGLLGAVKCNIDFVKDIGTDTEKQYVGNIDQFWYGDRYWQIVRPDDSDIDNYIHDNINEPGNELYNNQEIYPHHLIFTATVNPRSLCDELKIDQNLVPRQIAIFTRKKQAGVTAPLFYRAYENIFNFGQYTATEATAIAASLPSQDVNTILNFTIPSTFDKATGDNNTYKNLHGETAEHSYTTPNGEFKFLLNDYIRGQVRENHSIDRFGYVISF